MHYANPTEEQALANIRREEKKLRKKLEERRAYEMRCSLRPIVYISSPYSDGDMQQNVLRAQYVSRWAVDKGVVPIAPHLLFPQYLSEDTERDIAMELNKSLIGRSKEMWVFGPKVSAGMKEEIRTARLLKRNIRYFNEELEEVGHL